MKIPKNRKLAEVEFAVPVTRPDGSMSRTLSSIKFDISYDTEYVYAGSRNYALDWVVAFVLEAD